MLFLSCINILVSCSFLLYIKCSMFSIFLRTTSDRNKMQPLTTTALFINWLLTSLTRVLIKDMRQQAFFFDSCYVQQGPLVCRHLLWQEKLFISKYWLFVTITFFSFFLKEEKFQMMNYLKIVLSLNCLHTKSKTNFGTLLNLELMKYI